MWSFVASFLHSAQHAGGSSMCGMYHYFIPCYCWIISRRKDTLYFPLINWITVNCFNLSCFWLLWIMLLWVDTYNVVEIWLKLHWIYRSICQHLNNIECSLIFPIFSSTPILFLGYVIWWNSSLVRFHIPVFFFKDGNIA